MSLIYVTLTETHWCFKELLSECECILACHMWHYWAFAWWCCKYLSEEDVRSVWRAWAAQTEAEWTAFGWKDAAWHFDSDVCCSVDLCVSYRWINCRRRRTRERPKTRLLKLPPSSTVRSSATLSCTFYDSNHF